MGAEGWRARSQYCARLITSTPRLLRAAPLTARVPAQGCIVSAPLNSRAATGFMAGQWPFIKSQVGTIESKVDNGENVRCQSVWRLKLRCNRRDMRLIIRLTAGVLVRSHSCGFKLLFALVLITRNHCSVADLPRYILYQG